ncbi:uncharacterized protein A4U43_C03F18270 [Asparagus officinalis]|uniref:CobN/magnesium chelatase domain-containing protein n=1 Tax=Asparagus officinalis TaxID=4686 RepID=A0A5P1FFD3_ASPOF|nr:uncharacterized protein A4U43_C03F18270 [Asparagus officinalis]
MYLSRKSFAFDSDAPSIGMTEKRKVFEMALSTADATFQNLDSLAISLTDVSHYFDSDPTNLVENLWKDGKKPSSYITDTTTANAQIRDSKWILELGYSLFSLEAGCSLLPQSSSFESCCVVARRPSNFVVDFSLEFHRRLLSNLVIYSSLEFRRLLPRISFYFLSALRKSLPFLGEIDGFLLDLLDFGNYRYNFCMMFPFVD